MFDTYASIFAKRGNAYQQAMATWPDARRAEFAALLAPLRDRPAGLVCDMPSGGGYVAGYLDPEAAYLAVEPSEAFFNACPSGGRHTRIRAPLTSVPVPSGTVDHVVSLAGLHHEPDVAAVFREMRRVVKADGLVVIADVACGSPTAGFLNGYVAAHNPQGHDGRFLDDATAGCLKAAGLRIREDATLCIPWSFANRREAAEFCYGLFGLEGVGAADVELALASELGFTDRGDRVELAWPLRRIVCSPAG